MMSYIYLVLAIFAFFALWSIALSFIKIAEAWTYWLKQQIVRDQLDGLNEAVEEAAENVQSFKNQNEKSAA